MTNTGFIDARISKNKVLIEQKSIGVDLKKEKLHIRHLTMDEIATQIKVL